MLTNTKAQISNTKKPWPQKTNIIKNFFRRHQKISKEGAVGKLREREFRKAGAATEEPLFLVLKFAIMSLLGKDI